MLINLLYSVDSVILDCCCSVPRSCPILCDPVDCSMPGFPIFHHLPELAQTQVHWVGDALQPSRPLLSPSLPTFNLSQHQGFFQWVGCSYQVAKILALQLQHQPFDEYSGLFPLGLTGLISLMSKGLKNLRQHHSLNVSILWPSAMLLSSSHICTLLLEKP